MQEPFAAAELSVPLSLLVKGWESGGSLSWRRDDQGAWAAHWSWKDDDTGVRHRSTFTIIDTTQQAETDSCGPHVAAISRMTVDGEDLGPMERDQLVYAMRDRFMADQGVQRGKPRPKPEPTTEGPTGRGWNQQVRVAAHTRTVPLAVPFKGQFETLPITVGQIVCPLLSQGFDLTATLADPQTDFVFKNGPHTIEFSIRQQGHDPSSVSLFEWDLDGTHASKDQMNRFMLSVADQQPETNRQCR